MFPQVINDYNCDDVLKTLLKDDYILSTITTTDDI